MNTVLSQPQWPSEDRDEVIKTAEGGRAMGRAHAKLSEEQGGVLG